MSYFDDVLEFHRAFDVPVARRPTLPSLDRRELRRSLIEEEYQEVVEALQDVNLRGTWELPNLAKELADLIVVCLGTAAEYGVPFDAVWDEVHKSNMSKLGDDGRPVYRSDGKVLKGPNYKPADVRKIFSKKNDEANETA